MDGNGIRTHNSSFFIKNVAQAKSGRFTECCRFLSFLLFPDADCPFSPFFFFSFLSPVSFSSDAVLHARAFFLFSFTTEEKKEGRCVPFSLPFFLEEKVEDRNAANKGRFRIQERKMEGRRDGCSRYPFSAPPGRQNFACDSDFRKRRDSLSCSMKKLSKRQI